MNLALLVVAYKRSENLQIILDSAYASGLREFFVIVDGLKANHNEVDLSKQADIFRLLNDWGQEHCDSSLKIRVNQSNFGCSATVLQGVDWISKSVNEFCVLEDDCIPSSDFFTYVRDGLEIVGKIDGVMLVSGSQFAPASITLDRWHLSHYALTWGWATNSYKWSLLRDLMKNVGTHQSKPKLNRELSYWRAGSRRAEMGYVDVWDTILVRVLFEFDLYSILPGRNLVTNVGFDEEATHTKEDSNWLNRPIENYTRSKEPRFEPLVDLWLSTFFYRISNRHFFSTKLTRMLDLIGANKRKVPPLYERWP